MSAIMLVTADPDLTKKVKAALHGTGAQVSSECATPKRAIQSYTHAPPALVILDYFIPESSGLEILKKLKQLDEEGNILVLSRLRTASVIERAFRLGAHDVLVYPVSPEVIRDTVLRSLAAKRLHVADVDVDTASKPGRKK